MDDTRWWQRPYWGADFETTGVDTENDRAVTFTLSHVFPDTGGVESTTWVVDPGVEVPTGASDLHGYTTERVRAEGKPVAEAMPEMFEALDVALRSGEAVCAFNLKFDFTLADREFRRHLGRPLLDGDPLPAVMVDPMVIDKRVIERVRGKGQRQLIPTAARWGVVLSKEDAHTSEGDVLATVRTAWKQAATTPWLGSMSLAELHGFQVEWYRDQTLGFAGWKRRQGESEEARRIAAESDEWPMRPFGKVTEPVS
jgi:DNA polymerase-3 subunit epsilon